MLIFGNGTGKPSGINKYIDPLTDFGFKRLFGNEPNKDLLIDLLNSIFSNLISPLKYTARSLLLTLPWPGQPHSAQELIASEMEY